MRIGVVLVVLILVAGDGISASKPGDSGGMTPASLMRRLDAVSVSAADIGYLLAGRDRRVRALSRGLHQVAEEAVRRSPTFARILKLLQDTDVIVQVVAEPNLPVSVPGRVVLAGEAGGFRFLRIQMSQGRRLEDQAALLGHELFHALEIGNATHVRDAKGLAALYRRIGFATGHGDDVDTIEAHDVERRILAELGRRTVKAEWPD